MPASYPAGMNGELADPERKTMTAHTISAYRQRKNEEWLLNQAPEVQKIVKEIFDELHNIELYVYWALDPEEKDGGQYFCRSILDHAHMLVDQAHEYRAALKANPPPQDEDNAA